MQRCLKYCKALGALALVAALGCGNKNLVPVKGVVLLDGKPIEGALVKFVPKQADAKLGHEATAETDGSGNFSLSTLKPGDGAWRGVYKVCVQKVIIDPKYQDKVPDLPDDPGKKAGLNRATVMRSMKYKTSLFPKKYMNANTTPLELTVPTDGPVRIDIASEPEPKKPGKRA